MKWKDWNKRKKPQGWAALTSAGEKSYETARRNKKPVKVAKVIAFKVDNFTRAAKAKGIRKSRKKR